MDLVLQKQQFLEKISLTTRFTGNRISSSPILQGVYISIENKTIHFYATDLNQYIHTSLQTTIEGKTTFIIEPKKIVEFVQLLSDGDITIKILEKQLRIVQGRTQGNFPYIVAEDFPLPPSTHTEEKITLEELHAEMSLVLLSASSDESRPVLTGIYMHEKDENMLFVSTDGFRLSLLREPKKNTINPIIIPATFFEYINSLSEQKKKIELFLLKDEKMVAAQLNKTDTIYTRIIEGEFPPYEKVLPAETKTTISVDRDGFLRNIKLVSVFARDFSNVLVCEFRKDGITIRPKKENNQENTAFQEAKVTGEDQVVAFNYRYLMDFLNSVKTEEVLIEILRSDAPVVFKLPKNENYLHIIMPVRIQE